MAIAAPNVKRRRLPTPPSLEEGAPGIERQLEHAAPQPPTAAPVAAPAPAEPPVLDGRSMRATGRTLQLNIKVSPATKASILRLAKERGLLVAEVIEEAVALLERDGG